MDPYSQRSTSLPRQVNKPILGRPDWCAHSSLTVGSTNPWSHLKESTGHQQAIRREIPSSHQLCPNSTPRRIAHPGILRNEEDWHVSSTPQPGGNGAKKDPYLAPAVSRGENSKFPIALIPNRPRLMAVPTTSKPAFSAARIEATLFSATIYQKVLPFFS